MITGIPLYNYKFTVRLTCEGYIAKISKIDEDTFIETVDEDEYLSVLVYANNELLLNINELHFIEILKNEKQYNVYACIIEHYFMHAEIDKKKDATNF